jgi:alpha-L-arabinofuranosidase
MRRFNVTLLILLFVRLSAFGAEPEVTLTIQADKPGAKINPAMWGIFFEDINFGADGGLYAELVKNRSFEFPESLMGWTALGQTNGPEILTGNPCAAAQPHYIRLKSGSGISNEGFRGIGIRAGETYNFSVQGRAIAGKPTLSVELASADGRTLASARLKGFDSEWDGENAKLTASTQEPKAHLNITVEGGTLDLDLISLFPKHTWKERPNGLRADMVQMLADLKPGFLRFPGGCIVEGRVLTNRYEWKNTIGPVSDRKLIQNRWNVEFASRGRGAKDYYQTFGLGFFEYFQLSEDLGAEPLPIINCGMACQYNSSELVPLDQLDPYIQDALDLIEFANGSTKTTWGAKRAALGHPKPFNLKLLGVGNEQWGPQYIERYAKFAEVLKAKHPEIQLIAAAGPDPGGEKFNFLWPKLRELNADIVDEHFYRPPDFFFSNVSRYDKYDRNGPKVFAGEYASHVRSRANNLEAAIAEAAVMTGFERNAEVVRMAAYAPLFAHVDAWQWNPDLIWVDNLRVMGTPSYYVQQLFSRNRGDVVLPVELKAAGDSRFYASAAKDQKANEVIVKVVNATTNTINAAIQLRGVARVSSGKLTLLSSSDLNDQNTLDHPRKVSPVEQKLQPAGASFTHTFPANSVSVLRVPAK